MLFAVLGLMTIMKSRSQLRHQLQLESLKQQQEEEIHQAKLQFFTNISHEFKTPLTLITGPLQQLLANYTGSRATYDKLLVVESNAKHLLHLINRLMDFRKLENNQVQLQVAEGNVVKFLKEIFLSFTEYANTNGYTYTFEASKENIQLYYDRPKLEQVFFNLIANAFKYTPEKGSIAIHVSHTDADIAIEIKDTGIGIPEEFKASVFERFFEVPQTKRGKNTVANGSGIGLAIAKNVVSLHHGKIEIVESTEQGSTFKVSLPLGRNILRIIKL